MASRARFLLTAITCAGCTVGPNFVPPSPSVPPAWHHAATIGAPLTSAADPQSDWWTGFDDPRLSALIVRATRGNLDLKIAVERIAEARAGERASAAAGLPTLSGTASFTRQRNGLDQLSGQIGSIFPIMPSQAPPAFGLYEGALDASWEIDLFGKVRRSVEASRAETAASIANRDDSLVSLQAEVAQTYIQLRAAQANLGAAKADIIAEYNLLELTKSKSAHGLTSGLDVKNAAAQLASSEAQAPQYDQQISTYLNSLAVLVGETPGALDDELRPEKPIPQLRSSEIPIGLPSALARRRPDIRSAEAQLHQQTANVGVAVAQLYPDVTLTGDVGQQSQQVKNFFKSYNSIFSFGPSVSLPFFEGGKIKANIAQAKAQQLEAALTYQKTVLSALQEIENALASYRTDQQRLRSLKAAYEANQAAVDIALDRYRHGLSTYLDVLNPQNTLIQAQQQLTTADLTVSDDLVTLYKALGGGWRVNPVVAAR